MLVRHKTGMSLYLAIISTARQRRTIILLSHGKGNVVAPEPRKPGTVCEQARRSDGLLPCGEGRDCSEFWTDESLERSNSGRTSCEGWCWELDPSLDVWGCGALETV
jgi:hypothetical protein